jgi:putative ABC transport system ATP-binding protein
MLISLENLTRVYRMGEQSVQALAGINLEIDAGDFVAISGPSGSGKSTLLHIIGGLDSPTSGKVMVEGRNLSRASGSELAAYRNRRIGFVFQSFHLHPTYNSLENVALPLIFAGIESAKRKKLAQKALEDVGLARRIHHRPNELSGGEKQRVCIARALVTSPSIILADEPTGNLDTQTGNNIVKILSDLNRQRGITLIIITHNLDIARHADRIIFMADGRIIEERQRL